MQTSIFATAKQIPAYTVALNAGLPLRRKGSRYWTCCPFHSEKTASLCFFEDGGYKCFGCGAAGDSISFTASLYGLPLLEAARKINGVYAPAVRPYVMNVFEWRNQQAKRLHEIIGEAEEYLHRWTAANADVAWNDQLFVAAIRAREAAQRRLEALREAAEDELDAMRREADHERNGLLRSVETTV